MKINECPSCDGAKLPEEARCALCRVELLIRCYHQKVKGVEPVNSEIGQM